MFTDIAVNLFCGIILAVGSFIISKYFLSNKLPSAPDLFIDNFNTTITNAAISLDNTYVHNYHHSHYYNYNNYPPINTSNRQGTGTTSDGLVAFLLLAIFILAFAVALFAKFSYNILFVCIWTAFFFIFLNSFMVFNALNSRTWELREYNLKNLITVLIVFWVLVFLTSIVSILSLFVPIEITGLLKQIEPLPLLEGFALLLNLGFDYRVLYVGFQVVGLFFMLVLIFLLILHQVLCLKGWKTGESLSVVIKLRWTISNTTDRIILFSFICLVAFLFLSGVLPNLFIKYFF